MYNQPMPAFIDLTKRRFGRLLVLSRAENNKHNQPQWLCRCDCGSEKLFRGGSLTSGTSRSCGCLNRDNKRDICIARNTTHGRSKERVYDIWSLLPYRNYSEAEVCERWQSFENFIADMGEPPTNKHTVDRIDNAKGYEPGNCRWATMKEQQNNRTNNRRVLFDGQNLTLVEWSERTGIARKTLQNRLDNLGWPISEALTLPASAVSRQNR